MFGSGWKHAFIDLFSFASFLEILLKIFSTFSLSVDKNRHRRVSKALCDSFGDLEQSKMTPNSTSAVRKICTSLHVAQTRAAGRSKSLTKNLTWVPETFLSTWALLCCCQRNVRWGACGRRVHVYLELHQVDVHVSVVAVLSHRVCELCDPVAGHSQPRLDLRQVEDDLPVGSGVQRWRFLWPKTAHTAL